MGEHQSLKEAGLVTNYIEAFSCYHRPLSLSKYILQDWNKHDQGAFITRLQRTNICSTQNLISVYKVHDEFNFTHKEINQLLLCHICKLAFVINSQQGNSRGLWR